MTAAVKSLQILLNTGRGAPLAIDGIYGPKTHQRLTESGKSVQQIFERAAVDAIVDQRRYQMAQFNRDRWRSFDELAPILSSASSAYDVDPRTLVLFLGLEARSKIVDGVKYFDVRSVSPSGAHHGLFQLSEQAWHDALGYDRRTARLLMNSPFIKARYNPRANASAAAAYIRRNREFAKVHNYKGEFTPEVDYAIYNQGHMYLSKVRGGFGSKLLGNQSGRARAIIAQAAKTIATHYGSSVA